MPFPFLAAAKYGLAGAQALSGLFGRKHDFRNPHIDPFSFTPDPNDPEIAMRRKAALLDIQRGHAGVVNEIGRAGLLGSSAAFGLLNQNDTQGAAELEGIPDSVYAKQRQDALTLYRDNANFQRQLALADQGGYQQEHMAGLDALGNLGEDIGYEYDDPYSLANRKKRMLSDPSLYDYHNYDIRRR